jgi:hypothetical protein
MIIQMPFVLPLHMMSLFLVPESSLFTLQPPCRSPTLPNDNELIVIRHGNDSCFEATVIDPPGNMEISSEIFHE